MKKLLALLLATVMLLSMTACGTPSKPEELEDISDEDWQAAAEALEEMYAEEPATEPEPTEPEEQIYEVGDTILTPDGMLEITISEVCFSDYSSHYGYVPGDESKGSAISEGEVYLFYTLTLNFIGDNKVDYHYRIGNQLADYNNGYTYRGEGSIYEVGNVNHNFSQATFKPLGAVKAFEAHGRFRVPDIVETDTESPLLLKFDLYGGASGTSSELISYTVRVR